MTISGCRNERVSYLLINGRTQVAASQRDIRAKQSPPMPVDPGSTTHCTAQTATAASMALPLARRLQKIVYDRLGIHSIFLKAWRRR